MNRIVPKARLVVTENIYHQEVGKQPSKIPSRNYTKWLDTDEQPYIRLTTVTGEWLPLDTGWIEKASVCTLVNEYKIRHIGHSGLTEEQKVEADKNTIEVSIRGDERVDFVIPPGESIRITPTSLSEIRLRVRSDSVKCLITLLPG